MTEGEYRVGINFNPYNDPAVDVIKSKIAELIDYIGEIGHDKRCTELAQNAFEDGAMWAVKSATKQRR